MGVVDTLKETIGLIQKVDNIDLYRQMLDLQTQVMSLLEENKSLRTTLETRATLTFKSDAYWRDGNEGPFCSRCWDDEKKLIRLHLGGLAPACPKCKTAGGPGARHRFGGS